MADFDLSLLESGNSSIDDFLDEGSEGSPYDAVRRVASLDHLEGFMRTASGDLIHMSSRDLWSLKRETSGQFVIERKFENDGKPLKG